MSNVFWEFCSEALEEGVVVKLDANVGYVDEAIDKGDELASVIEDEPRRCA